MNDPLIVGCRQPACNLYGVVHRLADRDRSLLEPLAQRLALQQFGDQIRRVSVPRAEAIYGDDIGMIECGRGPGFLLKTPQPVGIGSQLLGQQLKRDFTAQAVVAGSIHFAHGPGTERRQDFAVSELRSCGDGHKSENYRRIQFWKFSRTGARLCALWMLRLCGTTQLTQSAGGNQSASPITSPS